MSHYDSVILGDSPTGYWKLNETSGTSMADSSGNGNTGTLTDLFPGGTGTFSLNQQGLFNPLYEEGDGSLLLGGESTQGYCVQIPVAMMSFLNSSSAAFSFECWFATTSLSTATTQCLFFVGDDFSAAKYMLTVFDYEASFGTWGLTAQGTNNDAPTYSTIMNLEVATTYADGYGHHYVVTRTTAGAWTMYLDTVVVASTTSDSFVSTNFKVASLGALISSVSAHDETNNSFPGYIEKCAIYNGTLSSTQVTNHFNAGGGGVKVANVQSVPPSSDVSTGTWTPSSGSALYPMINETVPDDTNYISATATSED